MPVFAIVGVIRICNNHNARRREPVPVGANRPVALELISQVRSELMNRFGFQYYVSSNMDEVVECNTQGDGGLAVGPPSCK